MTKKTKLPQKLALAPILTSEIDGKALTLWRNFEGDETTYRLEIEGSVLGELNSWQYDVIYSLFGFNGDTAEGLIGQIKDRFALDLTPQDLEKLFIKLKDLEALNLEEAKKHPYVSEVLSKEQKPEDIIAKAQVMQTGAATRGQKRRGLGLYRGLWMLRLLKPFFFIGKIVMFATIPMTMLALVILFQHTEFIARSFRAERGDSSLAWFLLLGLLSNNIVATFVRSCSVYAMGGTVDKVVIRLFLGIFPRLDVWTSDTEKFSRRQAMWSHAAPLISRLFMASLGLLIFNATRHLGGPIPSISVMVSGLAMLSFLLTACPLMKSHGYYIMVEFLDEPFLRERSFNALFNCFNTRFHQNTNASNLVAYAMVSLLYMFLVMTGIFFVLKFRFLFHFGNQGLAVLAIFTLFCIWRVWKQMRHTNEIYWKNYRFERWRDRTFQTNEQKKVEKKSRFNMWRIIQIVAITLIVFGLLQPYSYRPSGTVTLAPITVQELTSDIEGIVEDVFYDDGSRLEKGTVIATLNTSDLEAQKLIYEADMREKELNYELERVHCEREKSLFETGATSEVTYQRAQGDCMKAKAEIDTLSARIDLLTGQIDRSKFVMPFDGQISELQLKERIGSFLRQGVPIASVADDSSFRVSLILREVDLPLIKVGAPIEVRVYAYPNRVFEGEILAISPLIQDLEGLKQFQLSASIKNVDHALQAGMTGYAKTEGQEMKVWEILTRSIHRFITIDFWAWLP